MENWRDLQMFIGKYEVSDLGNVRKTSTKKMLKTHIHRDGYRRITLRLNNKKRPVYLHTAVLIAFKGKRPAGLVAAHLNGNRADAMLSNLIWATKSENEKHKILHGTLPPQCLPQTHCKRGHALIGGNIKPHTGGRKQCRQCAKDHAAIYGPIYDRTRRKPRISKKQEN